MVVVGRYIRKRKVIIPTLLLSCQQLLGGGTYYVSSSPISRKVSTTCRGVQRLSIDTYTSVDFRILCTDDPRPSGDRANTSRMADQKIASVRAKLQTTSADFQKLEGCEFAVE